MALNTVSTNRLSTNVKPSNLSSGFGSLGSRNLIINGGMQINERGSGTLTVNSSTSVYPVDRWVSRGEGGSKAFTIQQISVASSGLGVRNAIKVTSSQAASVGSSDLFNVRQMIEGYNIQRMNFGESGCKSMTLSFTAFSSVAGTHSGAFQNSAQNRSYPFTYTLAQNTWTDVSVTIPPITDGSSWNETTGVGLRLVFDMGSGNNFRGTAGQWNSAQDEGATGAVRILETNGATWFVTKVQLEVGTESTDFEHRSFAEELSLCQRYYYQNTAVIAGIFIPDNADTDSAYGGVQFPVPMRAAPTVVFGDNAGNNAGVVTQHGAAHGIAATAGDIGTTGIGKCAKSSGNWTTSASHPIAAKIASATAEIL